MYHERYNVMSCTVKQLQTDITYWIVQNFLQFHLT